MPASGQPRCAKSSMSSMWRSTTPSRSTSRPPSRRARRRSPTRRVRRIGRRRGCRPCRRVRPRAPWRPAWSTDRRCGRRCGSRPSRSGRGSSLCPAMRRGYCSLSPDSPLRHSPRSSGCRVTPGSPRRRPRRRSPAPPTTPRPPAAPRRLRRTPTRARSSRWSGRSSTAASQCSRRAARVSGAALTSPRPRHALPSRLARTTPGAWRSRSNASRKPRGCSRRSSAALGEDSYARAAGEGFAALGAGHLEEARAAFTRARSLRPNGVEALEGLRRVNAATGERGFAAIRARGEGLEAQERWGEALQLYTSALRQDRSLVFAQDGKARAAARLQLGASLQALIDRPERLASPQARIEAVARLQSAQEEPSPGPTLRAQIARLSALLPEFDQPVHLSLISDSVTRVAIPSVGAFGAFARRDIELKPGHYTVIGTRDGYRDVRRDITVNPGQQAQTVNVSCSEPI